MLLTPLLLVGGRPLVDPAAGARQAQPTLEEIERAAERAGHHRRLRPLRPDRRPPALRQRRRGRRCSTTTPSRSRRCAASAGASSTATRPGSTCCAPPARQGARVLVLAIDDVDAERRRRDDGARELPAADDRRPRAQRHALLRAARARRPADRARDARLGADERAQRARDCWAGSRTRRAPWRCASAATTSSSSRRWRRTARTRPS